VHEDAPADEYWPIGQAVHDVDPMALLYVPAEQLVHELALLLE
jgi:hypothetical protein